MKQKIITIGTCFLIAGSIGFVLARNKSKIDAAANPVKEKIIIPVNASEVQGKLIGLYIKNGDFVRAGQVIAVLDASVYSVQLNSIEASISKGKLDLQRYTKLIEMGGATLMQAESTELQIASLQAEKKQVLE